LEATKSRKISLGAIVCKNSLGFRTASDDTFRFGNFREALAFVQKVGELAEAEGHHPDISFGWGYGTVSLRTKKIKGLHENDFVMAAKIDRLASAADKAA
jgi:4a-hydroxytetrahydrobiopterin dehydratase